MSEESPGQRALLGRVVSLTEAQAARGGQQKLPVGVKPSREEGAEVRALPGSAATPQLDVRGLSDAALVELQEQLRQEFHRRALEALEPEALVRECYEVGFDSRGAAKLPYLRGAILVCPGAIVARSASSHECSFAHIGEKWVWESELLIHDDVVKSAQGGREHQRSVSLVVGENGLAVDVITSKMSMGMHQMKQVRSFEIQSGELVLVSTRSPRATPSGGR